MAISLNEFNSGPPSTGENRRREPRDERQGHEVQPPLSTCRVPEALTRDQSLHKALAPQTESREGPSTPSNGLEMLFMDSVFNSAGPNRAPTVHKGLILLGINLPDSEMKSPA